MSTWNFSIDLGMYPLGSCTMKYNSRLNEKVARIAGICQSSSARAEQEAQGALELIYELQKDLAEITGLARRFIAASRRCARRDDRRDVDSRIFR
jgi:glycine dehydrogenase subunit 2